MTFAEEVGKVVCALMPPAHVAHFQLLHVDSYSTPASDIFGDGTLCIRYMTALPQGYTKEDVAGEDGTMTITYKEHPNSKEPIFLRFTDGSVRLIAWHKEAWDRHPSYDLAVIDGTEKTAERVAKAILEHKNKKEIQEQIRKTKDALSEANAERTQDLENWIASTRALVSSLHNKLARAQDKLREHLNELERERTRQALFSDKIVNDLYRLYAICGRGFLRTLKIQKETLLLYTEPIRVEGPDTLTKYGRVGCEDIQDFCCNEADDTHVRVYGYVSPLVIQIKLADFNAITITGKNTEPNDDDDENDIPHPHINEDGEPCFGQYAEDLSSAKGSLTDTVMILQTFLESFNESSAYKHILDFNDGKNMKRLIWPDSCARTSHATRDCRTCTADICSKWKSRYDRCRDEIRVGGTAAREICVACKRCEYWAEAEARMKILGEKIEADFDIEEAIKAEYGTFYGDPRMPPYNVSDNDTCEQI